MFSQFFAPQVSEIVSHSNANSCAEVSSYSGGVCTNQLTALQACFSGATSPPPPLSIPSTIDQKQGESDAMQLLNGLLFLNPTPECLEAVNPFLCLHIFQLCDARGNLRTTLREECLRIRETACFSEWARALSILPPGTLPVCEDLPDSSDECIGMLKKS